MATQKQREEFIRVLTEHTPDKFGYYEVRRVAERLLRCGATYCRIQEFDCSSPEARYGQHEYNRRMQERWEREQARLHEQEKRVTQRVEDLCASIECRAIFSGDPRGHTIKIKVPDGFTNDWGHEGIFVPTS